ncbi:ABC transporter ATP-binding protein [Mucinivorans hirudinis]|uniref:ABC transporter ATP-binding protein n=1 Tax=Mucinivorans hirudinis TaxID=1433126 RepID=A0A060R7B7_9BACT|nr:ABC transporter ATP-binding protein [Mucinivorans hirudinis]
MLKLSGIRKSFSDGANRINEVLRGVDLSVQSGEFVAITGVSGSGKSTLLNILGTLTEPDGGSYFLGNENMLTAGVDRSALRNRDIGFLFQQHRLLPQLTALGNVLLPTLANAKKPDKEQIEYAEELMKLTGVEGVAAQYPATLSGGEAHRVALCRALIMKPKILLADEPTGQLDLETSAQIAALLAATNCELATTIVMVTHSEEMARFADKIYAIREGVLE